MKGGPAAKAGLEAPKQQSGNGTGRFVDADAIVTVDGEPVTTTTQLSDLVALHKPGETLELRGCPRGKSRTVDVTLGNAPA